VVLSGCRRPEQPAAGENAKADPPSSILNDAAMVFQKAFWKRPSAGDNILHAERREWKDGDVIRKWQWFISVEPSPELLKYLREDNAFRLSTAPSVPVITGAPDWFTVDPADTEALQAPGGQMRLFFSKSKRVLFATDSGGGFRQGAPELEAPVPATQSASIGRLPQTPPPTPPSP
jgi:hypothetical protein